MKTQRSKRRASIPSEPPVVLEMRLLNGNVIEAEMQCRMRHPSDVVMMLRDMATMIETAVIDKGIAHAIGSGDVVKRRRKIGLSSIYGKIGK